MTSYTGTDNADAIGYLNTTTQSEYYGLEGDDTIYAHFAGANYVDGGPGNDSIYGAEGSQVTSTTVFGGSGNDFISALGLGGYGSGNTFTSTSLTAYLDGGTGNDTIIGAGMFDIIVGNGADSFVGSTVSNALNFFYDLYFGTTTIVGGPSAYNYIHASGGNDSIIGGNKGDGIWLTQYGGDTVKAGSGNDYIFSNSINNNINTGNGNDTVYAVGANNNFIVGGNGNNLFFVGPTGPSANVQVVGGSGNDTINASASAGINYLVPGTGSGLNVVTGGDYSNHIYGNTATGNLYERGGNGQDELIGGSGSNHFIATPGGDFITGGGASNAYLFNDLRAGNTHLNNFNTATDVIGINAAEFGGGLYGGETLTLGYNLINGTQSVANTGTFLYSGGGLYFDADGTGPASTPVQVAGLVNAPATLSPSNFFISATAF